MKETQIIKNNLNRLKKFTRKTCIRIILIVCLFLLLGKPALAPTRDTPINWELYKANVYESATKQLILQVDSYIKKYAKDSKLSAEELVKTCDEYDLDLKLVLAQGHLESHFGTKGIAAQTNSVFNVGAYDNGIVLYRYKNPNQSIEPYVQLIKARNLTEDKTETDLLQWNKFRDVDGKRYASSRSYERKLIQIISIVSQTTDIDSLTSIRRRFKPAEMIIQPQINLLTINNNDTDTRKIQQSDRIYYERWNPEFGEMAGERN